MRMDGLNRELLEWIKKNDNYDYSILTNCPGDFSKKLDKLNLQDTFKSVVNPENSFVRKPQKEAYLGLLKEIKRNPKEVLFIDDSPVNVQAAKRLQITSILYKNNKTLLKDLKNNL